MKRITDIILSFFGLILFAPILLFFIFLIYKQDKSNPFYVSDRIGLLNKPFRMIKLRSMIKNADTTGVDSTSADDCRITPVGHIIRRYKLDEVMQLWNVLKGEMSIVGPRPNVKRDVNLYTDIETGLLRVRPGITDFSSIVFSDEGEILKGLDDPDLAYNQLIRPWKSRLGLVYIDNQNFLLDLRLMLYTFISLFSRKKSLKYIQKELVKIQVDTELIKISGRKVKLYPVAPPGASSIVLARK